MYFIANELNKIDHFKLFPSWSRKGLSNPEGSEEKEQMNEFLLGLCTMSHLFDQLDIFLSIVIEDFEAYKGKLKLNKSKIVLWHPKIIDILYIASSIFNEFEKMQNKFLKLTTLEAKPKKRVARELEKAISNMDRYGLPQEIQMLFTKYWEEYGKINVAYANISSTLDIIMNKSFIIVENNPNLVLEFPDPESLNLDNLDSLTFKQQINGLTRLESSYKAFIQLIEDISSFLGFKEAQFEVFYPTNLDLDITDFSNGEDRTSSLYFYDYGPYRLQEIYYNSKAVIGFQNLV